MIDDVPEAGPLSSKLPSAEIVENADDLTWTRPAASNSIAQTSSRPDDPHQIDSALFPLTIFDLNRISFENKSEIVSLLPRPRLYRLFGSRAASNFLEPLFGDSTDDAANVTRNPVIGKNATEGLETKADCSSSKSFNLLLKDMDSSTSIAARRGEDLNRSKSSDVKNVLDYADNDTEKLLSTLYDKFMNFNDDTSSFFKLTTKENSRTSTNINVSSANRKSVSKTDCIVMPQMPTPWSDIDSLPEFVPNVKEHQSATIPKAKSGYSMEKHARELLKAYSNESATTSKTIKNGFCDKSSQVDAYDLQEEASSNSSRNSPATTPVKNTYSRSSSSRTPPALPVLPRSIASPVFYSPPHALPPRFVPSPVFYPSQPARFYQNIPPPVYRSVRPYLFSPTPHIWHQPPPPPPVLQPRYPPPGFLRIVGTKKPGK